MFSPATVKSFLLTASMIILSYMPAPFAHGSIIYVDCVNGSSSNTGMTPDSPLKYIQTAIDASKSYDTVYAAQGAYMENVTLKDKVDLLGGFKNNHGQWNRDTNQYVSVLQSSTKTAVFPANVQCTMDGFTIYGGSACVWAENSSPIITNCTMMSASDYGIYIYYLDYDEGTAVISNNMITGNGSGKEQDAGISFIHTEKWDWNGTARGSTITIENNTIAGNNGSGIYIMSKYYDANTGSTSVDAIIRNNEISENFAKGVYLDVFGFSKNRRAQLDVHLEKNRISDHQNEPGIYAYSNYTDKKSMLNLSGADNIINSNLTGILNDAYFEDFTVKNSDMAFNAGYAIQNNFAGGFVNAPYCWWGAPNGPGTETNKVNEMVTYLPCLKSSIIEITGMHFAEPPAVLTAGEYHTVTVNAQNVMSAAIPFDFPVNVYLQSSSGKGMFSNSQSGPWYMQNSYMEIPLSRSRLSFFYRDTTAGTTDISVSVNNSTGLPVTINRQYAVEPGPATRFMLASPQQSLTAGTASGPIIINAYDDYGNTSFSASEFSILLSSTSNSGLFSMDPGSGQWNTKILPFGRNVSSVAFYYRDTTAGLYKISLGAPSDTEFGWQDVLIMPSVPAQIRFISVPGPTGENLLSQKLTVVITDEFSNLISAPENASINLKTSSISGIFCNAQGEKLDTYAIAIAGVSSADFYYRDSDIGVHAISVEYNDAHLSFSDTCEITISPWQVSGITVETAESHLTAGIVSEKISVHSMHKTGIQLAPAEDMVLYLSSTSPAGIFADAKGTEANHITISAGNASAFFFYKDIRAGIHHITVRPDNTSIPAFAVNISVTAGQPAKLSFNRSEYTTLAGAPSELITVELFDQYGNMTEMAGEINLDFESDSVSGMFSMPGLGGWQNKITSPSGKSAGIYYKNTLAGACVINAFETPEQGWENAQASILVEPSVAISCGPLNPLPSNENPFATDMPLLQFWLSNNGGDELLLDSLRLSSDGTGNELYDVSSAVIVVDTDCDGSLSGADIQAGNAEKFTADNGTILFSGLDCTLYPQSVTAFLVIYTLSGTAKENSDFSCSIKQKNDMSIILLSEESGQAQTQHEPDGQFPLASSRKTISATGTLQLYKLPPEPGMKNGAELLGLLITTGSAEPVLLDSLEFSVLPANSDLEYFRILAADETILPSHAGSTKMMFAFNRRLEYGNRIVIRLAYVPGRNVLEDNYLQAGITTKTDVHAYGINSGIQVETAGLPVWGQKIRIQHESTDVQNAKSGKRNGCFLKTIR